MKWIKFETITHISMKKRYAFLLIILTALTACKVVKNTQTYTNALINETSPYLLQHAHNPVNWLAWNDETLKKAKAENKLMLISIGYAACHWCHVMEKESFSDTTVARVMNQYFTSIKIDREERPDIDNLYMTVCQMTKENGCGWPLSVITLPDGRPIWVGTYMPKNEWLESLNYFIKAQQNELPKLEAYAEQLKQGIQAVGQLNPVQNKPVFDKNDLPFLAENILKTIDFENGGQLGAPKFPTHGLFDFLLNYYKTEKSTAESNSKSEIQNSKLDEILRGVTVTLDKMANGGIYDHLGGGFARYSTDALWHIPHFEKMLYDNGQLVSLYSHAFQATRNPLYEKIVRQTMAFVEKEWLSNEGGFYTSFDADTEGSSKVNREGGEGDFYTWKKSEIDKLLGKNAVIFNDFYGNTEGGNWEAGDNILHRENPISIIAKQYNLPEKEVELSIENSKNILLRARNKRVKPKLDDKILTGWNALMLKGCVDAYRAFGEPQYLTMALKNGQFILKNQLQKDGRLFRNFQKGKPATNAFLEDYAYTIQAFIELYQVTFDEKWLFQAERMADYVLKNFEDSKTGMFHFTSNLDAALVARPMDFSDNVLPNPNAIMALNLHDLGTFLDKPNYLAQATSMMQNMYDRAVSSGHSEAYFNWCKLFSRLVNPPYEVAIVGGNAAVLRAEMMRYYVPNAVFLGSNTEGGKLSLLEDKFQAGETYIYVCQNKTCKYPVKTVQDALKLLQVN
jgi:uncharacterized protein